MIVNKFVFPRLIGNEAVATMILFGCLIIPMGLMCAIGRISAPVFIFTLCISSAVLSGIGLLASRCCAFFAKYGKNGLASGVNNGFSSIGFVIQNYAIVVLADNSGWKAVVYLWIALLAVCILCVLLFIPLWSRFKKK